MQSLTGIFKKSKKLAHVHSIRSWRSYFRPFVDGRNEALLPTRLRNDCKNKLLSLLRKMNCSCFRTKTSVLKTDTGLLLVEKKVLIFTFEAKKLSLNFFTQFRKKTTF